VLEETVCAAVFGNEILLLPSLQSDTKDVPVPPVRCLSLPELSNKFPSNLYHAKILIEGFIYFSTEELILVKGFLGNFVSILEE